MTFAMRKATASDIPAIAAVMRTSVEGLGPGFYDEREVAAAARFITVPDRQLIDDRTYFVVEEDSRLVACGGWSRRDKLFTGGGEGAADTRTLDPATEPARVRAMFVHPDAARRGLGRMILKACEREARAAGFRKMELMATLPGIPLYEACGYVIVERTDLTLGDGSPLGAARMEKPLR
jgi:GNAT superfamily N-acetyltransferase